MTATREIGDCEQFLEIIPTEVDLTAIDRRTLAPGVNDVADFIIAVAADGQVRAVYDKTCDHAGGRLKLQEDGRFRCPLHAWEFDASQGCYRTGQPKPSLPFRVSANAVHIESHHSTVRFPSSLVTGLAPARCNIRFVAHACVAIDCAGIKLLIDPWLFGPAFSLGWWHRYPPPEDVDQILASTDVVFLSHNHSDHMSAETLARVNPAAQLVVPAFRSGSARTSLHRAGFDHVRSLTFNRVYRLGESMLIAVLEAGDFRDDSGLYVRVGSTELLFTVDSNALNHWVLPRYIDILFTSFSSGASGYPWCWDIYDETHKAAIADRSKTAALAQVGRYLEVTRPRCYVPYAGFFSPLAQGDEYIATNLRHNTPDDVFREIAPAHPTVRLVDPIDHDRIVCDGGTLQMDRSECGRSYTVDADYIADYKRHMEAGYADFSIDELPEYFSRQCFRDNLLLFIELTEWNFTTRNIGALIDFRSGQCTIADTVSALHSVWSDSDDDPRCLWMSVRFIPFARVVRERLSWEELSIGFQCRFRRRPDIYNIDFWRYFSNEIR